MINARDEWSVWKDIAYPGRVHVPGAKGQLHVYDFTDRDMRALEQSGNAKVGEGWNIPICWEHQDVGPARLSTSDNPMRDHALGVFASIKRFSRTPDGRLKALLTGKRRKDYEKLEDVGFVSPEIAWDWTDTDGRVWHGPTVTHLAATARPVQRHQNRVGENPDRVPTALRAETLENLVRMSFSAHEKTLRVAPTLRLSIEHYRGGLRAYGVEPMASEDEGSSGGGKKNPSPWERIAMALSAHCGIQLGDVTAISNPDEFARLVEVAAMNYKAGSEPEVPEEEDDEQAPNPDEQEPEGNPAGDLAEPPPGAAEPAAPPVQMSLTVTDDNRALVERLVAEERAKLVRRAQKVQKSGALKPDAADALVRECQSVQLSLTKSLALAPCATVTRLEAFEQVRAGATVNVGGPKSKKPARLSQTAKPKNTRDADPPPYREDADQDVDATVDAYERMVGRSPN